MKLKLLFFIFFYIHSSIYSQELEWSKFISGSINNKLDCRAIKIDKSNNIYILGISRDSFSLNLEDKLAKYSPGNISNVYIFIIKYDKNKIYKWHKIIATNGINPAIQFTESSLDIDRNSNSYIHVGFSFNVWIDREKDTISNKIPNSECYLVLDSNGNKKYLDYKKVNQFVAPNYTNILSIDTLAYLVTYRFDTAKINLNNDVQDSINQITIVNDTTFNSILIDARTTRNYSLWYKVLKTKSGLFCYPQFIDNENNIVLFGYYSNTLNFDNKELSSKNNSTYKRYFLKLDKFGKLKFFKEYDINKSLLDENQSIITSFDNDNNFYTVINSSVNVNCDFEQKKENNIIVKKNLSVILSKYNKDGKLLWSFESVKNNPKNIVYNFIKVKNNKIYLISSFNDSVEIFSRDKSLKLFSTIFPYKRRNSTQFLAIYNLDGYLISAFKLRESYNGYAQNTKVELDNNNDIYLLGDFYDSIDFDPTHNSYMIGESNKNIFIAKYNQTLLTKENLDAFDSFNYGGSLNSIQNYHNFTNKIYPNPFDEKINIQLDKINQKTIVSILDVSGREIQKNHFENTKELEINTKNLAKGLYNIKLETDGETNYYKVVKE